MFFSEPGFSFSAEVFFEPGAACEQEVEALASSTCFHGGFSPVQSFLDLMEVV